MVSSETGLEEFDRTLRIKDVGIAENIECHERIARFHILAIHEMARLEDAQFLKQEAEQLNKSE
jgi:hypothetical protein